MKPNNLQKGILFAFLTAVISGVSIFYNKLVMVSGVSPLNYNIIKNLGASFILLLILFSSDKISKFKNLSLSQWKKLFLVALIGGSIPFVLFFEGLRTVPAINANLIHKSLFIWVAFFGIPLLKEKLSYLQIAGYLLIILGNFVIGGFRGFSFNSGELMVLTATLLWSAENIIAKIALKEIESEILGFSRLFFGCLILILVALTRSGLNLPTAFSAFREIYLILPSIMLLSAYVYFMFKTLSLAPTTLVTAVLIVATPVTNILTVVFNKSTVVTLDWNNIILTFSGILLICIYHLILNPRNKPVLKSD